MNDFNFNIIRKSGEYLSDEDIKIRYQFAFEKMKAFEDDIIESTLDRDEKMEEFYNK